MNPERWEKVAELYQLAASQAPERRRALVEEACAGDEDLRREVESLLDQPISQDCVLERVAQDVQDYETTLPAAIGPYRVLRLIAEGGMGAVYEAEQDHPRRRVALKVMRLGLAGPELLRRFQQESEALGRLQHPGIARIYEAGTAQTGFGKQPYFAMEYISGVSLLQHADAHNLGTPERLELLIKICDAIDHAHRRGIIHRDLKPANILVDDTGQPKVLDFGVARITDNEAFATRQTDLGQLVGTLAYMSPEQVLGQPSEICASSDVYALGVILYQLLSGRLPYVAGSEILEAVRVIREQDPEPLGALKKAFRGDLETIAQKALEKDKSRRYASAGDLAADLRRYLINEPILARRPSALYQARKFTIRHKALVSATAAIFLALLAGVIVSAREALHADRERDRALQAEQSAEAVNHFLQDDLLSQAAPKAQGSSRNEPDPDLKVRMALDRAAERITGKFDSQPLVEASIRRTIGLAYLDLSLNAQAQPQLERALEIRMRVLGPENLDTVTSLDELGFFYNLQGKYGPAEELLRKVAEVRQRTLGMDHKDTLDAISDLALVITFKGDDARAEPLFAKALETGKRLLGEEDADVLTIMDNLGAVETRLGKFRQAEALLEREVELSPRVFGPQHPDVTNGMNNLAIAYRNEGKFAQADALFQQVLSARLRTRGEEQWATQYTRMCLGISYRGQGRFAEARELLTHAMQKLVKVEGPEHPLTLQAVYALGELDRREGKFKEAEPVLNRVLEARRRVLGPESPYTAEAMESLGQIKLAEGAYADAEALVREALRVRQKNNPEAWENYHDRVMLGGIQERIGRSGEAKVLLASGYLGLLERESTVPWEYRGLLEPARKWAAVAH